MPTIIDALVVTLGLDAKGFKAGAKEATDTLDKTSEAAKKSTKEIEKSTREGIEQRKKASDELAKQQKEIEARTRVIGDTFNRAAAAATGMFAVLTLGRGFKEFIVDTTIANVSLDRLAPQLRMSVNELSAWQLAAKQAGGSAEGMTHVLQTLTNLFQGSKFGTLGGAEVGGLNFLGISQADLARADHGILKIRRSLLALKDDADRVTMGARIGLTASDVATITDPKFLEYLGDARGKAVTKAESAESKRLLADWEKLSATAEKLGRELVDQVSPGLDAMLKGLDGIGKWLGEHQTALDLVFAVGIARAAIFAVQLVRIASGLTALNATAGLLMGGSFGALFRMLGRFALPLALLGTLGALGTIGAGQSEDQKETERKEKNAKQLTWDELAKSLKPMTDFFRSLLDMLGSAPMTTISGTPLPGAGSGIMPASYGAASGDFFDQIRQREGFSEYPYLNHGQWFSGYGTRANGPNEKITRDEAERRLQQEIGGEAATVRKLARAFGLNLNQGQINALTDFSYNLGSGTLSRLLSSVHGNVNAIPDAMMDYNHYNGAVQNGLTARRAWEGSLFRGSAAAGAGARTDVTIGAIHINAPRATDAHGIARDLRSALRNIVPQANTGLA